MRVAGGREGGSVREGEPQGPSGRPTNAGPWPVAAAATARVGLCLASRAPTAAQPRGGHAHLASRGSSSAMHGVQALGIQGVSSRMAREEAAGSLLASTSLSTRPSESPRKHYTIEAWGGGVGARGRPAEQSARRREPRPTPRRACAAGQHSSKRGPYHPVSCYCKPHQHRARQDKRGEPLLGSGGRAIITRPPCASGLPTWSKEKGIFLACRC